MVSNASTFRFSSLWLCQFLEQLRRGDAAVLLEMLQQFSPGSRRVTLESQVNMFLNMFLWSSTILRAPCEYHELFFHLISVLNLLSRMICWIFIHLITNMKTSTSANRVDCGVRRHSFAEKARVWRLSRCTRCVCVCVFMFLFVCVCAYCVLICLDILISCPKACWLQLRICIDR